MTIPRNIEKEHILQAFDSIDEHGTPKEREATKFHVQYNNKLYSPKYVVSIANNYVNGEQLHPSKFNGGEEVNSYLNNLGFDIQNKIPKLEPKTRSREYNSYGDAVRDKIIYEYLFNAKTHRWLDENIIGMDSNYSRGYQSMGILHYIGLIDKHKGLFQDNDIKEAIEQLKHKGISEFAIVIESLERIINSKNIDEDKYVDIDEEKAFAEGKEAYRLHRYKERDPNLVKEAKKLFQKKYGELFCEACDINFEKVYGERGNNFIEAHHTKPVSEMLEGEKTKVEDIAMLCSNCHRMIHRNPMIAVYELKSIIFKRS
ncbi:HNH endonuclease [Gracilibacillus orientalis]|uniref:HNH endonuclease n=1 Tax=Gracilibacillus orientalis TaxID=334253 RepID=A0A1I4QDU8_9BACI|nr:HNH endonuclease [Gracilibacillus orientalis]SFM38194.1 HNH endonuclease [Gracilibacillus orientalis]